MRSPSPEIAHALEQFELEAIKHPNESVPALAARVGVSGRTVYRYLGGQGRRQKQGPAAFTKASAIAAFKDTCALYFEGARPTTNQYMELRDAPVSYATLFRLFGTWDAVLIAAGYPPIEWRTRGLPAKMRMTASDMEVLLNA